MGRDHHSFTRQCPTRFLISYNSQCSTICWMDCLHPQSGILLWNIVLVLSYLLYWWKITSTNVESIEIFVSNILKNTYEESFTVLHTIIFLIRLATSTVIRCVFYKCLSCICWGGTWCGKQDIKHQSSYTYIWHVMMIQIK